MLDTSTPLTQVETAAGNQVAVTTTSAPVGSLRPAGEAARAGTDKIQFTVGRGPMTSQRAQDLLRHAIPNGDPAAIFDRALTLLIDYLEKKKLAAAKRPRGDTTTRPPSRYVPASVRRAVWARDEGCCAFVGAQGRCEERGFLELHHVKPYAVGGPSTVENTELRCRAHNGYEATLFFGGSEPLIVRESPRAFGYSVRTEFRGRTQCRRHL
jgi:hypothetical protein